MKPELTTVLEISAKMVQHASLSRMATHVSVPLALKDSCARLTLMNVLPTPAIMVNAGMVSTTMFVSVTVATVALNVKPILTTVNLSKWFYFEFEGEVT